MFLYLGVSGCPHICTPPYVHMPPYICTPPRGVHIPIGPMLFCAPAWFWCICMLWGVVICLNVCWDTSLTLPLFGGCLPFITPPTLHCWFPLYCYSQGYWYLMWAFPLLLKGVGVLPHHLGRFGGTSALQLSTCSFLYIFCSALCLTFRPWLQLLLIQLQWYLLACHQCHQ